MLVVVGANGRTGSEILRLAMARGRAIRPVVRDDRDLDNLHGFADVQDVAYADPRHIDALRAVMDGASEVINCIDARTSGPGSVLYAGVAAENVVRAAHEAGAERILHLSVMGAYRWSYARLNRRAFYIEGGVRNCAAPWAIVRVSCTHDEVIEGHVAPPDGARPHDFKAASRYSPMHRADVAKVALAFLDRFEVGRSCAVGGPKVYTGEEMERLVASRRKCSGWRRTRFAALPPGDVSVAPGTTRSSLGFVPGATFEDALDGLEPDVQPTDRPGVYPRGDPPAHPMDRGGGLARASPDLRRVMHAQLAVDLERIGVAGVQSLDFRGARAGKRWVKAHDGEVGELRGVRALGPDGELLHSGAVDLLRDSLADEFRCWWKGSGIPETVWRQLDMGVRRRLSEDRHFNRDPLVVEFLRQNS
jgi:uncharacterized protein YbjT (DUF2867 family)